MRRNKNHKKGTIKVNGKDPSIAQTHFLCLKLLRTLRAGILTILVLRSEEDQRRRENTLKTLANYKDVLFLNHLSYHRT